MKRLLGSGLRYLARVRHTRAWPFLRPAYRMVAPFVNFKGLVESGISRRALAKELPRPSYRGTAPSPDRSALMAEYRARGLEEEPDTFVLYRVIGNDLVPRHRKGQSRENIAWILEHERDLPDCEKRWVVNRIADQEEEAAILRMLDEAEAPYLHIPFRWDEYRAVAWDIAGIPIEFAPFSRGFARLPDDQQGRVLMRLYRHKNNYVMNNNGARNAALADGRARAKWVLPWDGNCFVTTRAWDSIRAGVTTAPEYPYHVVPMARVIDNHQLLNPDFQPEANEEPQILFRRDAAQCFDPDYFYGRRPKVELFWRLGITGPWDSWPLEPWDLRCPDFAEDAGAFSTTGWVARLFSGQATLEKGGCITALKGRGQARVEAIEEMLDLTDERVNDPFQNPARTVMIDGDTLGPLKIGRAGLAPALKAAAEEALTRGPFSVVDKTTLPPSGDPQDYWHPAPYYWPNPLRLPGLPYVKRDGRRVPGTRMYEPLSDRYDRTRLQRLFDDTFALTLAWSCLGEARFAQHAVALIKRWFLDPETAMNPHLRYAQVRRGHNDDQGSNFGIIEMKDLYYFLDAVRLLQQGGWLSASEQAVFANWLGRYLHWLRSSSQGVLERATTNNHGTYYDLQVGAIAHFLGDWRLLRATLRDSRSRILQQFAPDGSQPQELARTTTAHYCCFNLQGWVHLGKLAEAIHEDLWDFEGPDGQSLKRATQWLMGHVGKPWPYPQLDAFDRERFFPLYHQFRDRFGTDALDIQEAPPPDQVKPLFHPHDGIHPFWQLGLQRSQRPGRSR